MEGNRLRELFQSGRLVLGLVIHMPSTAMVDIAGYAGFDFIRLDLEHGAYDFQLMENMVRAAEAAQLATMVRLVPDPSLITRVMDMGVDCLMFPAGASREAAENLVRLCRTRPMGELGVSPATRAGKYEIMPMDDYVHRLNKVIIGVMIESKEALEQAKEILSVPGIEAVLCGPHDLSRSLGVKPDDPVITEARQRVIKLAKAAGVTYMQSTQPEMMAKWLQRDKSLRIFTTADSRLISHAFQAYVQESREIKAKSET